MQGIGAHEGGRVFVKMLAEDLDNKPLLLQPVPQDDMAHPRTEQNGHPLHGGEQILGQCPVLRPRQNPNAKIPNTAKSNQLKVRCSYQGPVF